MIFGYYKNCLYTHRYKFSSAKKKTGKESQIYSIALGSDKPNESDRESRRDTMNAIFHDILGYHKEIYIDGIVVKSKKVSNM